jgi:uncharacterized DUF497 family protein
MEFEWDKEKNAANIQKHGFDFADGVELFDGQLPFLVAVDEGGNYGEDRWRGIGMIQGRFRGCRVYRAATECHSIYFAEKGKSGGATSI